MVINCTKLAKVKLRKIKEKIKKISLSLRLDILYIGNNPASKLFINSKKKTAEEIGIKINIHSFKQDVFFEIIKAICNNLNYDPNCTGYFVQLPIVPHLNDKNILDFIAPSKDVDCLTSTNLGKSFKGIVKSIKPATVEAIISILKYKKVRLKSKVITIINDSNLIGKPLAAYFLSKGATVIICNEFTKNLNEFTKSADILITAVGKAKLIKEDMVTNETIIIDAGITKHKGKTVGDVDFNPVSKKAKMITPVPHGIGPLTIACLFENLLKIYELQKKQSTNK